ncbi:MAG: hypothetical protein ACREJO_13815 [Phycisphaerales bacterium]
MRNYIEPFAYSGAVLLRRPGGAGPIETINDRNAFVPNFWRAVNADPEAVAFHADWPVMEADLHARHRWLVHSDRATAAMRKVREDPEYFDARIAGWWCWGACCWIGSGWCDEQGEGAGWTQVPKISCGSGIATGTPAQIPILSHGNGQGVVGKRVKLSGNGVGCGVHASAGRDPGVIQPRRPGISQAGWGINVAEANTCAERREWITDWMLRLRDRLRGVRVCCGHWDRVCDSPSTMSRLGLTGVFLDPPYRTHLGCGTRNRAAHIYANDRNQDVNALCDEVQAYCLKWGDDPEVRLALCGLEGEYPEIEGRPGWSTYAWKSNGGYGNQRGEKNVNAARERVWFSPHCLAEREAETLFSGVDREVS